mmetsp:Transcript_58884/g.124887  ORF Transcript_58884/g.124887 Transcript_58884/m.124887 type:complete len:229 (+) Transcript_58884:659-1345(+)
MLLSFPLPFPLPRLSDSRPMLVPVRVPAPPLLLLLAFGGIGNCCWSLPCSTGRQRRWPLECPGAATLLVRLAFYFDIVSVVCMRHGGGSTTWLAGLSHRCGRFVRVCDPHGTWVALPLSELLWQLRGCALLRAIKSCLKFGKIALSSTFVIDNWPRVVLTQNALCSLLDIIWGLPRCEQESVRHSFQLRDKVSNEVSTVDRIEASLRTRTRIVDPEVWCRPWGNTCQP